MSRDDWKRFGAYNEQLLDAIVELEHAAAESQGEAAKLRERLADSERVRDGNFRRYLEAAQEAERLRALAPPPVPIGMGEAGQGEGLDPGTIRAVLDVVQLRNRDVAWEVRQQFMGCDLMCAGGPCNGCVRAPAPKPAPIPTGMEPGRRG